MSVQRTIKRAMLKKSVYSSKDNHSWNRRRFLSAWQKLQIKKFGGLKKYIKMRHWILPRFKKNLDITIYG